MVLLRDNHVFCLATYRTVQSLDSPGLVPVCVILLQTQVKVQCTSVMSLFAQNFILIYDDTATVL